MGTRKEGLGRRRGGFTSKIHVRMDGQRRPLGLRLTGGETSDLQAVLDLIDLDVRHPKAVVADRGYGGYDVRDSLLINPSLLVISPKANRRDPPA